MSREGDEESRGYLVSEMFRSIQGEGPLAGTQTLFLRLMLCDGNGAGEHCTWCDTKYSWDKADPGYKYEKLTAEQIVTRLKALGGGVTTVTISGGNPVVQMDDELVDALISAGYRINVETQGTLFCACLYKCNVIVVSPKPPSAYKATGTIEEIVALWASSPTLAKKVVYKLVVFDDIDFAWARRFYEVVMQLPMRSEFYLQAGTNQEGDAVEAVLSSYKSLINWLLEADMPMASALPQIHPLVWGRRKGI